MKHRRLWIAAIAACLLPVAPAFSAAPVHIEGQTFDATVQVAGADLQLNGVGLRAVAWFKGYAAGLYLPAKAGTPAQVLATTGPKRLQLRLLQDVPAAEFVKAIDKGIERNTAAEQLPALNERRGQFDAQVQALGKVKKGDIVNLDFVPGRGMVFTHNGQTRGDVIAGDDFYSAVLRIFLGEHPVDDRLKAGLLGG